MPCPAHFQEELEALIAYCTDGAVGFHACGFPLARLTQAQLDRLPMPPENLADLLSAVARTGLKGMMFHSVYDDTGTVCNEPAPRGRRGARPAVGATWQVAFRRHEVLRTGFLQGRETAQWVARSVEVPLEGQDWRERADLPQALETLAQAELARSFDLAAAPT